MICRFFGIQELKIAALEGVVTPALQACIPVDSSHAPQVLRVEPPDFRYRRLNRDLYERTTEARLSLVAADSVLGEFSLSHTDSLPASQVNRMRKSPYPELRGENPRFFWRTAFPVLISGTGIAGIISLFYIRSR